MHISGIQYLMLSYEAEDGTDKAKIVHNRLIIPRGKMYRLVLEDGTKVWLNSETAMIRSVVVFPQPLGPNSVTNEF